jgi:hypothetical protein
LESGAYVPCWNTEADWFAMRSSYQRMPTLLPAVIECETTIASWSPKLR